MAAKIDKYHWCAVKAISREDAMYFLNKMRDVGNDLWQKYFDETHTLRLEAVYPTLRTIPSFTFGTTATSRNEATTGHSKTHALTTKVKTVTGLLEYFVAKARKAVEQHEQLVHHTNPSKPNGGATRFLYRKVTEEWANDFANFTATEITVTNANQ